jgi:hypothetical protein
MPRVHWLDAAVRTRIEPRRRIMPPSQIEYDLLDEPVRDFVGALNTTGVVETLLSCAGHPFETPAPCPSSIRRTHSAHVLVHVLDPEGWHCLVTALAGTLHSAPELSVRATFEHESWLWLIADPGLSPRARRTVLDRGLARFGEVTARLRFAAGDRPTPRPALGLPREPHRRPAATNSPVLIGRHRWRDLADRGCPTPSPTRTSARGSGGAASRGRSQAPARPPSPSRP